MSRLVDDCVAIVEPGYHAPRAKQSTRLEAVAAAFVEAEVAYTWPRCTSCKVKPAKTSGDHGDTDYITCGDKECQRLAGLRRYAEHPVSAQITLSTTVGKRRRS